MLSNYCADCQFFFPVLYAAVLIVEGLQRCDRKVVHTTWTTYELDCVCGNEICVVMKVDNTASFEIWETIDTVVEYVAAEFWLHT